MDIKDIFPKDGKVQRIYCENCGQPMVLTYSDFNETISGTKVSINRLPYLFCESCDLKYLPDHARFSIIHLHQRAFQAGTDTVSSNRQKIIEDFGFTKVKFLYDPDDYYYIPGLQRDHDSGFLTPVFFNRSVLLKFQNHSDYRVRFASRTYGSIYKGNDFDIAFGINKSGKVIMWLGDIATLEENEQYYLRSENVESDHDIGSEFYDGQIEVKFTDYTPEDKLIHARTAFLEFCTKEFGTEVNHLTNETLRSISELNPPILHTEKEQKDIVDLLNKINVESLDAANLGNIIARLGGDPKDLGGLKRFELLFSLKFPEKDVHSIVSPLFVLYDLRVNLLHAVSDEKKKETLVSACQRLGIPEDSKFDVIYPELLRQLTECYENLIVLTVGN